MSKKAACQSFLIFSSPILQTFLRKRVVQSAYRPWTFLPTYPPQEPDESVATVVEKQDRSEDLPTRLSSPHMLSYQEKVKELVEKVSLGVLTEA
jgi:hypothetical protein